MTFSLHTRLSLVLFLLLSALGALFIFLNDYSTRMYQQESLQRLSQGLASEIAKEHDLLQKDALQQGEIDHLFHVLMQVNPAIEIYTLDRHGSITGYAAPDEKIVREHINLKPLKQFFQRSAKFPILGDDPRSASGKKIFSAAPVYHQGELSGYLYVILGGEQYDNLMQALHGNHILRVTFWVILAGILVSLLAGFLMFSALTRKLRTLTLDMDRFRKSGFTERTNHHSDGKPRNEIARLSKTFDEMSGKMVDQVARLKQGDQLRRELVANVSHDLRTPLTTLHGYLETLLRKHNQLSQEEQKQYLETATRQSERLGKLVSELFELAKLDANETRPVIEPFSLPELTHDVIQKFWLHADQRNISIKTEFQPELPFVSADIGLIERVLENLIENAIRYTANGDCILVSIARHENAVRVKIQDNGVGIAEKDLPMIFEKFYRAEKSRAQCSGGAGLGLAIAKRILELHGSTIQASSKFGSGTTFTFSLPTDR